MIPGASDETEGAKICFLRELRKDSVHLWIYAHPIDAALSDETVGLSVVSDAEVARARRFHFARDRKQFLASRILLRQALTYYVPRVGPSEWAFAASAKGKPYVSGPLADELQFNLSHTQGMVVLAFGFASIGVDVESMDRTIVEGDLAIPKFFEPGERAYLGARGSIGWQDRFLDIWTLKEARLKAAGLGLSSVSQSGDLFFHPDGVLDLIGASHRWRLWQTDIDESHKLALACPVTTSDVVPFIASLSRPPVESLQIQAKWETRDQ